MLIPDAVRDWVTTMDHFERVSNFQSEEQMRQKMSEADTCSMAWEDFNTRLGELSKFIPRIDQVSTLYQNISLTEPRMIPQYERVLLNFINDIKLQHKDMERLALAAKRAQDQAAMQLSAMEEEMDQCIHTVERNTRIQESKKAEAALSSMREQYEAQLSELQQKICTLQMFENQSKCTRLKEENVTLKRKNTELTLQNQKLKQDLLESQTNIAFLRSELDSVKSDLTDQSINLEQDEALMRCFSEERDNLERQIELLQSANRKLHDSNDGLRMALENSRTKKSQQGSELSPASTLARRKKHNSPFFDRYFRVCLDDDLELRMRTQSCESLALALCDPMRRLSSCEVDSLDESCVDSGMSTLRSNIGYDSDRESTDKSTTHTVNTTISCSGDTSDTEVAEVQDEAMCGSVSDIILNLSPPEQDNAVEVTASGKKCLSAILTEKEKDESAVMVQGSEKTYKIVLAGDAAVGKSSFLLRLCKNEFKGTTSATLGVDFQMKTLVVDGVPTVLQLWDTAGQERFRSIAKSYFRRADGVLLLYDVTCERSFLNVREWIDIIRDVSEDEIPIMMVGNKTDLRQEACPDVKISCISTSYGERLAMTYGSLFCETSAKEGSNIIEAVLHLAREVIKHAHDHKDTTSVTKLSGSHNKKMNSSKCCNT